MATSPQLTLDGYEYQFGINHVAHALLIKLLLPTLQATASSRIISLTSLAYMFTFPAGIDFSDAGITTTMDEGMGPMARWLRYGQSKLASVIYAAALARRYPEIICVAIDPGMDGISHTS
jgi:NAD(P)-dependent dehydrogenase (short-subunit alcohol dehydrogenase family)